MHLKSGRAFYRLFTGLLLPFISSMCAVSCYCLCTI